MSGQGNFDAFKHEIQTKCIEASIGKQAVWKNKCASSEYN